MKKDNYFTNKQNYNITQYLLHAIPYTANRHPFISPIVAIVATVTTTHETI